MRNMNLEAKYAYLTMMSGIDVEEVQITSENFKKVKKFYNYGMWSLKWVHDAVGKWITEKEYLDITGSEYKKA